MRINKLTYWCVCAVVGLSLGLIAKSIVYSGGRPLPSFHQGFARNPGESMYPRCWKDLQIAWVPALGIQTRVPGGNVSIRDVSNSTPVAGALQSMTQDSWIPSRVQRINTISLDFDGTNDYIKSAGEPTYNDFTLAAWIVLDTLEPTSGNGQSMWRSQDASTSNQIINLQVSGTGSAATQGELEMVLRVDNGTIHIVESNDVLLVIGQLHYVVGLRRGAEIITYIDGVFMATLTAEATALPIEEPFNFGWREHASTNDEFNGRLLAAQLYTRALSDGEILREWRNPLSCFRLKASYGFLSPTVSGLRPVGPVIFQ